MSQLVSRESFLNRYGKPKTRRQAEIAFIAWDNFLKYKNQYESQVMQASNPYLVLDEMVQFWKIDKHANTVKNYFQFIKDWFRFNDITIDDFKVRQNIKFPKPIRERPRGIDRDMIKKLVEISSPFYKALFIVQACSGMRIDTETLKMRPSWINFEKNPVEVLIPGQFTKTGQERLTFLTNEAVRWIKPLIHNDDIIFDKTYATVWTYFDGLRKKLNLTDKGANGFYHFRLHKERGFCESRVSRASGSEVAHALLGHTKDLIQYFQGGTTDEEFANDYRKAMGELTIESDAAIKDENELLKARLTKTDQLERMVLALQDKMRRMEAIKGN